MKNLINKINFKQKTTFSLSLITIFILLIGASVYAWSNQKAELTPSKPTAAGDKLKIELTESQIIIKNLLAKKLNYELKDINVLINQETSELINGIATIDSPNHTQALNFTAKKINNQWRLTEATDNTY